MLAVLALVAVHATRAADIAVSVSVLSKKVPVHTVAESFISFALDNAFVRDPAHGLPIDQASCEQHNHVMMLSVYSESLHLTTWRGSRSLNKSI
jgi:hypothetical protein